jgi:hypothetical protein
MIPVVPVYAALLVQPGTLVALQAMAVDERYEKEREIGTSHDVARA